MDVSVIVGTFGSSAWRDRAQEAAASVTGAREVVTVHAPELHLARNWGAMRAAGEWLCFLDADDTLAPGYFDVSGEPDELLAPVLELHHPDGTVDRPDLASRNIEHLNPCCIGTLVHRDLFARVGGFWDESAWEDWSFWLRCVRAGARVRHVDSVYRAQVRPDGRNRRPGNPQRLRQLILDRAEEFAA